MGEHGRQLHPAETNGQLGPPPIPFLASPLLHVLLQAGAEPFGGEYQAGRVGRNRYVLPLVTPNWQLDSVRVNEIDNERLLVVNNALKENSEELNEELTLVRQTAAQKNQYILMNNMEGNKQDATPHLGPIKSLLRPAAANKEPEQQPAANKNNNNMEENKQDKQETIAEKNTLQAPQDPEQMKEAMLKMEQENKDLVEQKETLMEELMLVRRVAAQMNQMILQNIKLEEEKAKLMTEKKSSSEKVKDPPEKQQPAMDVKSSISTTFQEVRDSVLLKQKFLEEKCVETARSEAQEAQEKLRLHIDELEKMVKSLADA